MSDKTRHIDEALFDLIGDWTNGSISEHRFSQLTGLLGSNVEARRIYVGYMSLHADLAAQPVALPEGVSAESEIANTKALADELPAKPLPIYLPGCEPKPSRFRPHHYAIAVAAVLLVAGIVTTILSYVAERDRQAELEEQIARRPVATLIEISGGGHLNTPHDYPAEGSSYGRGEYALDNGAAEFMLTNAVNVKLRGETRMFMRDDMNVSLTRGGAEFVVPRDASGFTVHLDGGVRIIDLGTAFRVEIGDAGQSKLLVTDGQVRVELATGATQIVHAGYAAKISGGNTLKLESAIDRDALAHRWTFNEGDGRDDTGEAHGDTIGGARIADGRLLLDGNRGYFQTDAVVVPLTAKTLVAWVRPANVDQRGGGVVSVQQGEAHDQFDAIVFGELTQGVWMAGSEGYGRSMAVPQDGGPEAADLPDTVMVAIAYDKNGKISVYRDGELYSSHDTNATVTFNTARVLIGLRHSSAAHITQQGGQSPFFAGEVDEARIYSKALSAQEIDWLNQLGPESGKSAGDR